ncbi:MAG: hypothetical protein JEY79_03145 [Pseudodesulfovibrio sp.]|nr:hypothetical protein [Pseudodesulfovibrio sp.]
MSHIRCLPILAGLLFSFLFPANVLAQDTVLVRRAAFDIGSAAIKCTIADVDIATGRTMKTFEELSQKIDFAEDLARSYDGNFSKKIMNKGIEIIKKMKLAATKHRVVEYSGVGGTAFRSARNGRAYFVRIKDETGIQCRIISEQQAALLSYHAARQRLDISKDILVWDIGGSGMQITSRDMNGGLTFYVDAMASVSFKNVVIDFIQKKDLTTTTTPNPMSRDEVKQALNYVKSYAEINIPPALISQIRNSNVRVAGIGGVHYFSIPETLGQRNESYTSAEVKQALEEWTDKPDNAFESEYANTRLTNLILVLGYMKALNIDAVFPLKINEANGLLAAPEFW